MRVWLWALMVFAGSLVSQDMDLTTADQLTTDQITEPTAETDERTDERTATTQPTTLSSLQERDRAIVSRREAWSKSERRLKMLLKDLNNRSFTMENKTANLQRQIDENNQGVNNAFPVVPIVQIEHWNSRKPHVAAKDFIILFKKDPAVAVSIVKGMKKKKSAALIDAVSGHSKKGVEVSAKLHVAMGIDRLEAQK